MPDVVATAEIVEPTRSQLLREFESVNDGADQVDGNALDDGGIEKPHPLGTAGQVQLNDRSKAGCTQRHVECYPSPGHVRSVEGRMPRQDDTADAQDGRGHEIDPPADGFAVECRIFRRHDGSGNQQGDPGVVDAREALHQRQVGDAVHRMPADGEDEALAGGKEEHGGKDDVGVGREHKVHRGWVEVESNGKNDEQSDSMRPNVDRFVGQGKGRPYAFQFTLGKPIALDDVRIDAPWRRQIVVGDESPLLGPPNGTLDAVREGFFGPSSSFQAFVHHFSGRSETLLRPLPTLVHDSSEAGIP